MAAKQNAKVAVRLGRVGLKLDRLRKSLRRFVELILIRQNRPQCIIRVKVVRLDGNRLPKCRRRLVEPSQRQSAQPRLW